MQAGGDWQQLNTLASQLNTQKEELDDLKAVACPVLRAARVDSATTYKLYSVCGLH
jgi:hypothetical protein